MQNIKTENYMVLTSRFTDTFEERVYEILDLMATEDPHYSKLKKSCVDASRALQDALDGNQNGLFREYEQEANIAETYAAHTTYRQGFRDGMQLAISVMIKGE
jgi:hypothetical protein